MIVYNPGGDANEEMERWSLIETIQECSLSERIEAKDRVIADHFARLLKDMPMEQLALVFALAFPTIESVCYDPAHPDSVFYHNPDL